MARYIGPKTKIARKFGEAIFGEDKYHERRNYPPGQHGFAKKRGKRSEYALQLLEKQKAKYTYGILERQFRNIFKKASNMKGITGELLLQLCESRLDNVAYRMGISPTRQGARQFITHGHVEVNGKPTNIPSYTLKPGDTVSVREKSKNLKVVVDSLEKERDVVYDWILFDKSKKEGSFVKVPERAQIPENINEQLIVELYSK